MTKKPLIIRKPYNDRVRTSITFPEKTMAKQSFKDECNINNIMSKYANTGLIDHVQKVQGSYGDFTSVADYQLSLNQVIDAQNAFDELPAALRKRFGNNPSQLMEFLSDASNQDEAVKLGLIEPKSPPPQPEKKAAPPPSGESETPPKKAPEAPPQSA